MSNLDLPWLDSGRWDLVVSCGEVLQLELGVDDSAGAPADLTAYTFAAQLYDVRGATPVDLDVTVESGAVLVTFPAATTAALTPLGHGWRWRLTATAIGGDALQVWQFGTVALTRR